MEKKFELTNETKIVNGKTLYRIKALKDFYTIKKGDLGGFVQNEDNLSHEGNCWIYDEACVFDKATVGDNAKVFGNAHIYHKACVYGNAKIYGNANIVQNACIFGNAVIFGNVVINEYAHISSNAFINCKKDCFFSLDLENNYISFFKVKDGSVEANLFVEDDDGDFENVTFTIKKFREYIETLESTKKAKFYDLILQLASCYFEETL